MTGPAPLPRRELIFTLWIFVMFLYAYADILGLFDPRVQQQLESGVIDGITMSPGLLIAASVLMFLPISMILAVRVLSQGWARWTSFGVALFKTVIVIATLTTPSTLYDWGFSIVEVITTLTIAALCWTWRREA